MRPAEQGKLWTNMMILLMVLIICVAFFGFLLFDRMGDRYYTPDVRQKAQFNAMNAAIELSRELSRWEFDDYPPSGANDPAGRPYCGSMKLTEALMGRDLLGFHTKSIYRRDGRDAEGESLYPADIDGSPVALRESSLKARRGPFLQAENANAWRLADIYGKGNTGPFAEDTFVLCDSYPRNRPSGEKTGMPILYYRADPSGTTHDIGDPDNPQNIYHYEDNQALLLLGVPGEPGATHPLADPKRFYLNTQDRKASKPAPCRPDTFILISAGKDGLYGTADDICNFDWKYRRKIPGTSD